VFVNQKAFSVSLSVHYLIESALVFIK